jgi:hypothetical protein
MSKRGKTGGRQKGTPNKNTAQIREALLQPFNQDNFDQWAKNNPDLYYTRVVMPLQPKDLNMRIIKSWDDLTQDEREALLRKAEQVSEQVPL